MNTHVKRVLLGVLLGGGVSLLGAVAAQAADTNGEDGLLSGTQAIVEAVAPVTVTGNSLSVLGDSSSAQPAAAAPAAASPAPAPETSGTDGTASGTQAVAPVTVPLTVTGNAVSVGGDSTSASAAPAPAAAPGESQDAAVTDGADGILSGTQVVAPVTAPVTVAGTAVSVLGDAQSAGTVGSAEAGEPEGAAGPATDGADGAASGTQVVAPLTAPITVTGNAISVGGDSATEAPTTDPMDPTDPVDPTEPGASDGSGDGMVLGSPASVGQATALAATLAATGDIFPWVVGAVAVAALGIGVYLLAFWRLDHVRSRKRL